VVSDPFHLSNLLSCPDGRRGTRQSV
jgi:hypothetical protein